jgi:hypothetical protein
MSFKRFDPQDFLISADSVVGGIWTGGGNTLNEFYTSSVQLGGTTGQYYTSVFQTGSERAEAEVQFNVTYGNAAGSGSAPYDANIQGKSPTSTIYGQWQNIVLGDEETEFEFGGVTPAISDAYVITFERSRFKSGIFPGTLNLILSGNAADTEIKLTDNSKDVSTVSFNEAGRVFQLVSGSDGKAIDASVPNQVAKGMTASGSFGLFLPDVGALVLNPAALDLSQANGGINLGTSRNSTNDKNPDKIYTAISLGESFEANSQETITSDFVFVRARNAEFNYSNNPSFISGSTGELTYNTFINSPQTFITSVGMYNDNNELLAVAKLSKPLKKDFTKETLIRVKLDF